MSFLCWNCNLLVWCLLKCFYEFLFLYFECGEMIIYVMLFLLVMGF